MPRVADLAPGGGLGFTEYGCLNDLVAIGSRHYDTVFHAWDLPDHPGAAPG